MKTLIPTLFHRMASALREREHLWLEYLARRHQLEVLQRLAKRPRFSSADRGLWLILPRGLGQGIEIELSPTVHASVHQLVGVVA